MKRNRAVKLEEAMKDAAPPVAPDAIGMAMQCKEAAPRFTKAQRIAKLEALYVQVNDFDEIAMEADWATRRAFAASIADAIVRLRLS